MKVLTIGGATQDVFIEYENPETLQLYTAEGKRSFLILEEGKKIEITGLIYSTGGGATNSAVSFARIGFDVATFCKIGNDPLGETLLQKLITEGVTPNLIVRDAQHETGQSFIIPTKSGDRTILTSRGANAHIKHEELPMQALHASNLVYVTSLSGNSSQQLITIVQEAKKNNALVALNPGGSQLESGAPMLSKSLAHIDIVILNSTEASQFMVSLIQNNEKLANKQLVTNKKIAHKQGPRLLQGVIQHRSVCFNLSEFFQEIISRGPSLVVVTNGAEGVYAATKEAIFFHPSMPTKVVNTVGAGDAFGSCFVASIAQGKTVHEAMLRGILNSCSVISSRDAKTGLLTHAELDARFAQADKNLLQTFPL